MQADKSRSVQKLFDDISLNVVRYLEEQPGVTGIQLMEKPPGTAKDITLWEKENYPFLLPQDLKNFYMLTDGLLLRWCMSMNSKDELLPLGCMNINGIAALKKIQIDSFKFRSPDVNDSESSEDDDSADSGSQPRHTISAERRKNRAADPVVFNLDSACQDGHVALLFRSRTHKPEVWFQDLACEWHFLAISFSDYFRLLVMHVGLPHWQYVFTDVGLPPASKEWFRYIAPERLAIDLKNARTRDPDIEYIEPPDKRKNSIKLNLTKIDKAATADATKKGKKPPKLSDAPPIGDTGGRYGNTARSSRASRNISSAVRSRTSLDRVRPRSSTNNLVASRMRRSDSQGSGGEEGNTNDTRPASAAATMGKERLRTYSSSGSSGGIASRKFAR
mmetsp:Transcript_4963/g.9589  ORF Transcript_4963/g.9589 Transcript_4963/m.9589 type:complete len:390 (+) Transcript_4963:60-1229(+)